MKALRTVSTILAVLLSLASSAFASTTRVYSSTTLVLAFVGFLALIVVIQLIPAVMTLYGAIKGLTRKEENVREANAVAGK